MKRPGINAEPSTGASMEFQYVSDLHLEARDDPVSIARRAPNLVVAGDVCSPFDDKYAAFVAEMSATFDRVFMLTGNHCYYSGAPAPAPQAGVEWNRRVDDEARAVCASMPMKNVHFLQNDCHDVEGTDVTVFGGTLWSDVAPGHEHQVRAMVADYRFIPGFTVDAGRRLHRAATASLSQALLDRPDRRFVVATHHVPRTELIAPKYRGHAVNSAFASDVACAYHPRIAAWVYGHTHAAHDDDLFHCNPLGYPGEATGARLDRVFAV